MKRFIPELIVSFSDHGFTKQGYFYNDDRTYYHIRNIYHDKDGSWSLVTMENTTIKVRAEARLDWLCLAEEED